MIEEKIVLEWLNMSKEELISRMIANRMKYEERMEELEKKILSLTRKDIVIPRTETLEKLGVTK